MEVIEEEYVEEIQQQTLMNEEEMEGEVAKQAEVGGTAGEDAVQREEVVEIKENNNVETEGGPEAPIARMGFDNADLVVKTEIKQLLRKKISEEMRRTTENGIKCIFLKQRNDAISKKREVSIDNANLQHQIEIDNTLLEQSKNHVVKIGKMLTLMGKSFQKLSKTTEERASETKTLLEKSSKQRENFENLRLAETELKNAKKEIEDLHKTCLGLQEGDESELNRRQKLLDDLKRKFEEVQKSVNYDDIIKKSQAQKSFLLAKIAEVQAKYLERRSEKENELSKATKILQKLQEEKQQLSDKLNSSLLEKGELEEKSLVDEQELKLLEAEVFKLEQEREEKKKDLTEGQESLARAVEESEEATAVSQKRLDNVVGELQGKEAQLLAKEQEYTNQLIEVKSSQGSYIQHSDDHANCYNNILEQQKLLYETRAAEQTILAEHREKMEKREKLRKRETELLNKVEQIEVDIAASNKLFEEQSAAKLAKCEELSQLHSQNCDEFKKKKEYASTSLEYFTEKSANLQDEVEKHEMLAQKRLDQIADLQPSVAVKEKELEELKIKIQNVEDELKKTQQLETQPPLKSRLRSPAKNESLAKKVQFNDKLSFKSPTESSETLSQSTTQPNKSKGFQELLALLRTSAKPKSSITSSSQPNLSKDL